jgi:hypothetical protein
MSDQNQLTEQDDDELIPVETAPEAEAEAGNEPEEAEETEEEEDEGDERLAESDDDHDEEVSANRKRRQKRREVQKRAKENAQREIEMLRQINADLARRVSAIETHTANSNAQTLDQRLAQAVNEVQQAEHIIAKATEQGNGDDVVAAMRLRDQAIANAQQLQAAKQQFEQARQQATQPRVDPAVVNYAKQWMDANPWYDPQGGDRDSALTKGIDNELAREGYNPATREYWEELTARVADAIGGDEPAPAARPKRKAPPTGNTREHAPVSTKKEIYVTPERKQAMIDAGVWDDPALRQRYLKAYQSYDNGSAR